MWLNINANGPVVGVVSIGCAVQPVTSPCTLADRLSRLTSSHGALFAIRVQNLVKDGGFAVQIFQDSKHSHGAEHRQKEKRAFGLIVHLQFLSGDLRGPQQKV